MTDQRQATTRGLARGVLLVLFVGFFLPVAGGVSSMILVPGLRWDHVPFHAAVEFVGGFFALALAAMLLTARTRGTHQHHLWVAAALIGMGILDIAHAAVAPGDTSVWFRSTAMSVGGLLAALVWLPSRMADSPRCRLVPPLTAVGALALCACSLGLPRMIPTMVHQGAFTTTALGLNTLGGLGFLVAAGWFLKRYLTTQTWNNCVCACLCGLFGAAGMLEASPVWDTAWWWSHVLRLAAYGLAIIHFAIAKRAEAELLENNAMMVCALEAEKRVSMKLEATLGQLEDAREEAEAAQARTRHLLESIPSILISLDKDGKITEWNSTAEISFGIAAASAPGCSLDDCGIQWDADLVMANISACRSNGRPSDRREVRYRRPDGTDGVLDVTASPVASARGKVKDVLLVATDITDQKILERQFAHAQKLESIGQLAAGIAHEINTPIQYVGDNVRFLSGSMDDLLGLIVSYRELISEVAKGENAEGCLGRAAMLEQEADLPYLEEEVPKSIAQSLDGIGRVSKIVRAMKDFSHPGVEEKEAIDLSNAIESTITVARNEWKYVAELVTDFDPALPPVPCLVGDFNQVILNMVINAAQAIADVVDKDSGEKGTITVATRRDGDWAEIRISDTGTGVAEEHRSKVFDHFFTTKEVGKGTGQGLAIAHAVITEKHNGTITVESEMGKGTTFVIRLPIKPKSVLAETAPQREAAHSLR